jgi:hypothetical protein
MNRSLRGVRWAVKHSNLQLGRANGIVDDQRLAALIQALGRTASGSTMSSRMEGYDEKSISSMTACAVL